jgi:hypothetical protein
METEFVLYLAGDIPDRMFIANILKETSAKAGFNWNRVVKPPAPPKNEEHTQAFQTTVMSFIMRASLMSLTAHQQPVVVMPYCGQPEEMNRAIERMSQRLPRVTATPESKHILLVSDMKVVNQLRMQLPRFGSLHGEMEKGGIIVSSAGIGQWFVITWHPAISTDQLGNMLRVFLTQNRIMTDADRESIIPESSPFRDISSGRHMEPTRPLPPEGLVSRVIQHVSKIGNKLKQ